MSDDFSRRKVEQSWEPGTLDATRRNIGPIDKEEAARMTQILGGEIKMEKSAPVDYSAFPPKERSYIHRSSGKTAGFTPANQPPFHRFNPIPYLFCSILQTRIYHRHDVDIMGKHNKERHAAAMLKTTAQKDSTPKTDGKKAKKN